MNNSDKNACFDFTTKVKKLQESIQTITISYSSLQDAINLCLEIYNELLIQQYLSYQSKIADNKGIIQQNNADEVILKKEDKIVELADVLKTEEQNCDKIVANKETREAKDLLLSNVSNVSNFKILSTSNTKPIRELISISEKFLFINDLFHNDSELYNLELDNIDKLDDINLLNHYLKDLSDTLGWQEEDFAFKEFKRVIELKFRI